MDSSLKTGLMAVFAVSGSVVFVAMQVHKRLLSKFMDKMEFEFNNSAGTASKEEPKKKVRFADDVAGSETTADRMTDERDAADEVAESGKFNDENLEAMPENWQAMYREILHMRNYIRASN